MILMTPTTLKPQTREEQIAEAVQDLLDLATYSERNIASDETFYICHVCGDCDSHKADCFVPLLQKWQES